MGAETISFGPFVLDRSGSTLLSGGRPVSIGQRGYALLEALAAADGHVTKSDLMEAAWPGTIVEEGNLTVQIAALRKALGPRSDGQEWIVTVPRIGYRLLRGEVSLGVADAWPRPTIAVLPFQVLGGGEEREHFANGMIEELISALGCFRTLSVISFSSSSAYQGRPADIRHVARELGANYLLEGSVRTGAGSLRLSVRLVDGESGAQLWGKVFEGEIDDAFVLQDRLSAAVTSLVEPQIRQAESERSKRERPGSMAPYDLYLRAHAKLSAETAEGNAEAIALLEAAMASRPDNGTLLSNAAWAYEHRINMGWPVFGADDRARCAMLARAGLDQAAGDPRAMGQCAMALATSSHEYDLALSILRRARDANPNDILIISAFGIGLLHLGDLDEAEAVLHHALDIAPAESEVRFPLTGLAHICMIRGAYEEALTHATPSLAVNRHFDATYWMLIAANAHLGRVDEARKYVDQLMTLVPGITVTRIRAGQFALHADRMANILAGLQLAGLPEA